MKDQGRTGPPRATTIENIELLAANFEMMIAVETQLKMKRHSGCPRSPVVRSSAIRYGYCDFILTMTGVKLSKICSGCDPNHMRTV